MGRGRKGEEREKKGEKGKERRERKGGKERKRKGEKGARMVSIQNSHKNVAKNTDCYFKIIAQLHTYGRDLQKLLCCG
jgi:hypothetical protein